MVTEDGMLHYVRGFRKILENHLQDHSQQSEEFLKFFGGCNIPNVLELAIVWMMAYHEKNWGTWVTWAGTEKDFFEALDIFKRLWQEMGEKIRDVVENHQAKGV